jgi:hypothetical protein
MIEHLNAVIDRVMRLDQEVLQAYSFRAQLEALEPYYEPPVTGEHADAITMMRSAVLRSLISCVAAIWDPQDHRGNRASLGQIVHALQSPPLAAALAGGSPPEGLRPAALLAACARHGALAQDPRLRVLRDLRNDSIAHSLIGMVRRDDLPYEDIYGLEEEAEALLHQLFDGLGLAGAPEVDTLRDTLRARAGLLWRTYFAGMGR